jgi:choline dehydrogenase-like flavoprotein
MLHANVTDIELGQNFDRVISIHVRSLEGQTATLRSRMFVLCVGGIETARVLLSNNRQVVGGIGNQRDLVGRYFQDHPSAFIGTLNSGDRGKAQRLFNVFHKGGLKYSVRCTATTEWQRQNQTLNASMGVTFEDNEHSTMQDMKDVYIALRQRTLTWKVLQKIIRSFRHPPSSLLPAYHYAVRGRTYIPGARMRIGVTTEQEPNPESRILLSDTNDALGIPRTNVRWQLTQLSLHTFRQFALTLCDEFSKASLGDIALEPWVLQDSARWTDQITDQNHHIGTARMHDSPQYGVVDRNCKVHSVSNLFIAGSAVFPTSGHSNPTLTIIALCKRLADRLKQKIEC